MTIIVPFFITTWAVANGFKVLSVSELIKSDEHSFVSSDLKLDNIRRIVISPGDKICLIDQDCLLGSLDSEFNLELEIGAGAHCIMLSAYVVSGQRSERYILNTGSVLELVFITKVSSSSKLNQNKLDQKFDLMGTGARVISSGTVLIDLIDQKADASLAITSSQKHVGAQTESVYKVRALLGEKARMDHVGLIRIEDTAGGSNALFESKQLLLSQTASSQTRPSLEVLTDEVRCSHGTASGPIDEQQLLYAQSRGMSRENAQRLLREAFVFEIYSEHTLISQEWVQEQFRINAISETYGYKI